MSRWSKKKSWLNDVAPTPGANTWLTFTGNVDLENSNDFAAGSDFGALTFYETGGPATLTGNAIDLFTGIYNGDAGVTHSLNLDGITLASPSVAVATLGNIIIASPLTGSGTLVKSLGGTLFLEGVNAHTGGTRIQAGAVEITEQQNLGIGALTLEGGTLRINPPASGTVTIAQNILVTAQSALEAVQGRAVLTGTITGDARLLISGPGTVEAAIDSSLFRGGIDVANGILLLTGTQFVPVEVHGGEADLLGSVGDVETFDGGTLSVLDTLRTAELKTLDLAFETGARLAVELHGTTPGAAVDGYDQIKVAGSVLFGGTLQLSILPGFAPALGQSFFLIENDGTDPIAGAFSNALNGGFYFTNGFTFAVAYTGDAGTGLLTGGNDLVLTVVPAIPEPGTELLGAAGMLILLRRRHPAVRGRSEGRHTSSAAER